MACSIDIYVIVQTLPGSLMCTAAVCTVLIGLPDLSGQHHN